MRGRLISPFLAELHRLDFAAMATRAPTNGLVGVGFDPDFKEPVLVDADDDGMGESWRIELPPIRVPCQVEPEAFEALRMVGSGNAPRSSLDLVFHFKDLERLGLVDVATGDALIRPSDRLGALFDIGGRLVQSIRTPPGLYAIEAKPTSFGLSLRHPRRNLLIVSFQERPAARGLA